MTRPAYRRRPILGVPVVNSRCERCTEEDDRTIVSVRTPVDAGTARPERSAEFCLVPELPPGATPEKAYCRRERRE
jgi:hypothetical protein